MVRVHFNVLVVDVLFFESDPYALDEGAEPAGVEFERLLGSVGVYYGFRRARGVGEEVGVRVGFFGGGGGHGGWCMGLYTEFGFGVR